ncbi:MAG: N-acetylmuramoyl-L-alanine amidase [Deltaproteobacteria bacterium]|nr:N-acetylmuramoyl-L-alanine amidase [Deltaproteobacteria bacterium]
MTVTALRLLHSCLVWFLLGLLSATACWASAFRVAIDIGHSPKDPGAISARGVPEYRFNRNIATLLLAELRQDPRFKDSFIINETGEAISLSGRSAWAERQGGDVLLSIHHDSVYPEDLSQWFYQGKIMDYCDLFSGHSIFYSEKNGDTAESFRFAVILGSEMRRRGFTPTLHHANRGNKVLVDKTRGIYRFDNLVVLKSADIPAVLFECGIIKNRNDELLLSDPKYQQRLVTVLYNAIAQYYESRKYLR